MPFPKDPPDDLDCPDDDLGDAEETHAGEEAQDTAYEIQNNFDNVKQRYK